jgi:ABC-type transport system involved in cytochrome c biogenesis permease subunit
VFEGHRVDKHDPFFYIAGLAPAYVSTFIAIFFNVALAACARRSMRGKDTKVGEGISAAAHRIGPILGWTFVATTVGLVLRALEERLPALGKIVAYIAGAAWAIATFFVIPVVALEGSGPFRSLQRSAAVVKARWGRARPERPR